MSGPIVVKLNDLCYGLDKFVGLILKSSISNSHFFHRNHSISSLGEIYNICVYFEHTDQLKGCPKLNAQYTTFYFYFLIFLNFAFSDSLLKIGERVGERKN